MADTPWSTAPGQVRVRVRLTPKSSRDEISGIEQTADGPALKARVRAVPEDGRANAALIELFARWLGVPKSSVTLTAGGKSRVKTLAIEGQESVLVQRMAAKAAAGGGDR